MAEINIGKLGIWAFINSSNATDTATFAQRIEQWGYSTLWIPDAFGRDPMIAASWIFANTKHLNIGTGIANIYGRDSLTTIASQHGLAEQSNGRFLLGLGVSHSLFVEDMRGHKYEKPVPAMKRYLESMAAANYFGAPAPAKPKTVIAALGPKMLELAASHADGVLTYNVTPEHTAQARTILGEGKLLCVEQMVILETDQSVARAIARKVLAHSLLLPNYRNSFLRMGFHEDDFENDGSDRLIDAIVVWGNEKTIAERMQQHWDAGADHVCIQSLPREGMLLQRDDEKIFELLAPSRN